MKVGIRFIMIIDIIIINILVFNEKVELPNDKYYLF